MYNRRALNNLFFKSFLFFMERKHLIFTEEHIFYSLISDEKIKELLSLCTLDFYSFDKILEEFFKQLPLRDSDILDYLFKINDLYQEIIDTIFYYKKPYRLQEKDLLWVLIRKRKNTILDALLKSGFNLTIFDKMIEVYDYLGSDLNLGSLENERLGSFDFSIKDINGDEGLGIFEEDYFKLEQNDDSLGNSNFVEYFLVNVTVSLDPCLKKNPLIGREKELFKLIQVMLRRHKSNLIVFGEPGVGKTILLQGLAYVIKVGQVPQELIGYEVYSLDIGRLISGTRYRGDLEDRVNKILDFLYFKKKVILFIDEIHMIVGAGATSFSNMDVSNLLKPILTLGRVKFIGATTKYEYQKFFLKDKALMRRFHSIELREPSFEDAYLILKGTKEQYEKHHNVEYTDEALWASISMSKYIKDRFLPDKAFDLLDDLGAKFKLEGNRKVITGDDMRDFVKSMIGSNIFNFDDYDNELLINLESKIREHMIIDEELLSDLILNIKLLRIRFLLKNNTLGIFILMGSSDINKSKLVSILSEELKLPKLTLGMSEYGDFDGINRLIGPVYGAEFYDEPTKFFKFLSKSSSSIIFLADFDKSPKRVIDFFFEGFNTGKLFDNFGRGVSLSDSIIIMDINVEHGELNGIGFKNETVNSRNLLEKRFSSRFLDLVDHIFFFRPLDGSDFKRAIIEEMNNFVKILKAEKVYVCFEESVINYLKDKTYKSGFGIKGVRKVVVKEIGSLLVNDMILKRFKENDKVRVYLDETIQYELL
ncbi:ATP-dependent Clp protease ATP-binding subunit ClpA [Borrelia miyamotoi]|uniref:ATP-dependent Clp protease ATP-binding subunit n=2 Tax=Borrelia miyamotoi TaxID=47466 RepID=A0AAP8YVN4_9SPIR|nr:ATP-dependent Clp protease ATP-binding subunit [Borrelia miyamotoi]AHH05048.1 ATP-dependent clp protease ATP-binding subunit clpA [Borrelia miyamotoi FR64b]ATQ14845.1 ATP-dependent Clp protease ATP-binding subunit [Borrelia miyamotoi]ATQ16027.1 ATP-dependent Clp protease ATP-binding subunit [Borrelia miyamotoi]ATQ17173.1 ATP-dependent Clp protease ATP-binding subunit [Borrelia miyamotoi]ATQ18321.1 ATP-dependent Clp protease ATP-binding subunit [Borrelia miyamotoi]